jgi:hypothetical protein
VSWLIALHGARNLFGKRALPTVPIVDLRGTVQGEMTDHSGMTLALEPVYELVIQVQAMPNRSGQMAINRSINVVPLCWLSSVKGIVLPASTPTFPLEDLSRSEHKSILTAIAACEELLRVMRAADAGIAIAQTLPPERPA